MSVVEILNALEYGPAPESADPAIEWIQRHDAGFRLFVGGRWLAAQGDEKLDLVNPATGRPLATVAQAVEADVDAAVSAAREAFPAWRETPSHARARHLYALARQIQRHARLFAVLESVDNGKPIRESRDIDVPLVARHFYYHAGWAQLMSTELAEYEAIGVIGQIIPWNFPLLMLAWKVAPALAMGNTVVLKPAEFTPLTALLFAEVAERAGLPPGVLNIITGDGRTGQMLVRHTDVDKIAFTGSTEVGRSIRRETAGTGKKLSLELGGKSPFLVFEDADLDSVVEGVVDAIWFNQGQVCCAGSRLLVQESISEVLFARLKTRMERLRIGDPLDKAVDIGAIIAPVQLRKIEQLVQKGLDEGADMWQPSWACPAEGYFFPPTLFTNVAPAATIAQVEIFGPVLVSMTFRTPLEAVELANNTPYGLAASVWTENINLALDISRKVKAGTVWINSTNLFDAAAGFGGYRESGFGREGGREGLYEYVKRRNSESRQETSGEQSRETLAEDSWIAGRGIDRTPKLLIGGRQVRADSGYSRVIYRGDGAVLGEVGEGNRKDIRNAVEAAHAASTWSGATGHARAQILYYIAENLSARRDDFVRGLEATGEPTHGDALREVDASIEALFRFAAWSDKFDGQVHQTPFRNLTLAVPEPIGVMAILCPDQLPLLGFVSLVAPAVAMGNTVVVVPSQLWPLSATDLYQVLDTSDVPSGVINIVTGAREPLAAVLAEHDDVDAIWYFGESEGVGAVERASAGNMKRTYAHPQNSLDRLIDPSAAQDLLRECTQVKNIWTPYGE